ncbi:MAG TPA: queuosine salvage family protein [Candidatus Fimivivens sp.]|nr:queuosine salvage family protein [Candidatus Fimivivens sp.]
MKNVLDSTKYVCERSKSVSMDPESVVRFCDRFDVGVTTYWWKTCPFDLSDLDVEKRMLFLLSFNAISFSYWSDAYWLPEQATWREQPWEGSYRGGRNNGAWGLASNLARALVNGRLVLEAGFLAALDGKRFAEILGNQEERTPLFSERLRILQEIGRGLIERYDGIVSNLLSESHGDADTLVGKVIEMFPSFTDIAIYEGQEVEFCKRAQLFVADVIQTFGEGVSIPWSELGKLTACADYKLPQVLRHLGILRYSDALAAKVDHKILLEHGGVEEVEIRANTIWAVETIREELAKRGTALTSIEINDYLWLLGQRDEYRAKPYHRTRTTAY